MNLNILRTAIDEAVSVSVGSINLPGIVDAVVRNVAVSPEHLQRLVTQVEQNGQTEVELSADVELFLRISNSDLLSSIQGVPFRVKVSAYDGGLQTVATAEQGWAVAWERGIEPIKQTALQSMKEDVWNMDATLAEDSSIFQTAMILFASELVGPWSDLISTFLGYPPALVQAVAARLYEARIWENDEVRSEKWFDPEKGGLAFMVDLMVAEGMLIRRWSEEDQQFAYRAIDMPATSRLAI
jgi:hypothetical protein